MQNVEIPVLSLIASRIGEFTAVQERNRGGKGLSVLVDMLVEGAPLADMVFRELLLFAGIWIAVGLVDELAIDILWAVIRLRGRGRALQFVPERKTLRAEAAVFIPCWHEDKVIGHTVRRCRNVWPYSNVTFYLGVYPNDPATAQAIRETAGDDPRVRLVVLPHPGPTTKADCLNFLYAERQRDLAEGKVGAGYVLLHDAEDHVHEAALELIDERMQRTDFVQLPVQVEVHHGSLWISGHYIDEFAENHGKTMVVRDWLRTSLPAAGVGCAFSDVVLAAVAQYRGSSTPFEPGSLTEDYELGILVTELGFRSRFVRARTQAGELIATREYFPHTFRTAERQKARWLHGIAFQGWDNLGWSSRIAESWMRLRDRRGPLIAVILFSAYLLLVIWAFLQVMAWTGLYVSRPLETIYNAILVVGLCGLAWRAALRFAFTFYGYGLSQGILAIFRLPVGNLIAIIAARRALFNYVGSLRGRAASWDKTAHERHPSIPYQKKRA